MVGLFEGKGAAWNPRMIPKDFSFGEVEEAIILKEKKEKKKKEKKNKTKQYKTKQSKTKRNFSSSIFQLDHTRLGQNGSLFGKSNVTRPSFKYLLFFIFILFLLFYFFFLLF